MKLDITLLSILLLEEYVMNVILHAKNVLVLARFLVFVEMIYFSLPNQTLVFPIVPLVATSSNQQPLQIENVLLAIQVV